MKAIYLYTDDWLFSTDIAAMTPIQERGYLRLLIHQSKSKDGKVLADDAYLGRITMMGTKGWKKFQARFPHLLESKDGRICNPKQFRGWQKSKTASKNGEKGAKKRWLTDSKSDSEPDARHKDLKTYRLKEKEKEFLSPGGFEEFLARISILALARSQDTPPLLRIPRLFALNPAHHLRR